MQSLEEEYLETSGAAEAAPEEDDGDGDLSGDEGMIPPAARAARAGLTRKYRHLRRALQEDGMAFADENFEIKPLSGEIWANSEIEVTITFRPDTAAEYACSAFLDVIGRDERLPLWLTGNGIGPKGMLSYDVLDIGDVFINSRHRYELVVTNKGDIPAAWRLRQPTTPFAPKFTFEPTSGSLAVGATQELTIDFCSDILGEFSEQFSIELQGSDELLTCQFKGHVVGPTFHFDVDVIDFGVVSYEFSHHKTITLYNTAITLARSDPERAQLLRKAIGLQPTIGQPYLSLGSDVRFTKGEAGIREAWPLLRSAATLLPAMSSLAGIPNPAQISTRRGRTAAPLPVISSIKSL